MSDIDPKYFFGKNGIRLMCSGKVKTADESRACPFFISIGQFFAQLQLDDDEVMLIDIEGGIVHFARGTDNAVDRILMIVDPTLESIKLAEKASGIAASIGKPCFYIINR